MTHAGLNELRERLKEQARYINSRPYAHNIVGLLLAQIDKHYGEEEAKKAIKDFGLDKKGW